MEEINLNYGVYQIRNIITNVCYTGQSINLKHRPCQHWSALKNNKHWNGHLQNSYNKHGKEFFVFEILIYCKPEKLTYYEQLFYDIDKSHGLSYNARDCVDSNKGIKLTEETCKKISEANSRENHPMWGKHHSEETLVKMSEATKGENHPMYGKHRTEETKEKIRENHVGMLGKTHTEASKQQMAKSHKGKTLSNEHKKNISQSLKGVRLTP